MLHGLIRRVSAASLGKFIKINRSMSAYPKRIIVAESDTNSSNLAPELEKSLQNRSNLCIVKETENESIPTFMRAFSEYLTTQELGKPAFVFQSLDSTMNVVEKLSSRCKPDTINGLIVIAEEQTNGKGRKDNIWVSNQGCAMMSLAVACDFKTKLGQSLSFLQHLTGLACLKALEEINCDYQKLNLMLKWPNDILHFHQDEELKVGGIYVKAQCRGSTAVANIGIGINVDNAQPTTCINEIIARYNEKDPENQLPAVSKARFIAEICTVLENFLHEVSKQGVEAIVPEYHRYWCHNDMKVKLISYDSGDFLGDGVIHGVDNFGRLLVKRKDRGDKESIFEVDPDVASFDYEARTVRISEKRIVVK